MSEQTLNIPQLVAVLLVGFLAFRWFFSSSSSAASASSSTGTHGGTSAAAAARSRRNMELVERVVQMFPQMNRRDVMWDLQRNGGNVEATVERVVTGRGLEVPPPSFQPQFPAAQAAQPSSQPKSTHPDLITRYNLSSKVDAAPAGAEEEASTATASGTRKAGWSSNKTERQQLMQRRREEMVLAARRKMQEREKGKQPETA